MCASERRNAEVSFSEQKFVQDQAKWVASYLAGEYALPSPDEMRAAIKRDEA